MTVIDRLGLCFVSPAFRDRGGQTLYHLGHHRRESRGKGRQTTVHWPTRDPAQKKHLSLLLAFHWPREPRDHRVSKGSGKYTPTPYGEQLRSLNDSCNPPLKFPNRLVFSRSPLAPSPRQLRSSASHARTGHLRGTRGVSRQEACNSARAGLTPPGSVNGRNGLAQAWRPEARRGVRGARSSRGSSP